MNDGTPQSSPLEILPKSGGKIYANDRLHLVRATLVKVENNWFVMNGLKPDVPEKVVEGIADVRFERVGDTLTVWVLARGNTRHDAEITLESLSGWPEKFGPIDAENRHYRLKAVQRTWRLRNE